MPQYQVAATAESLPPVQPLEYGHPKNYDPKQHNNDSILQECYNISEQLWRKFELINDVRRDYDPRLTLAGNHERVIQKVDDLRRFYEKSVRPLEMRVAAGIQSNDNDLNTRGQLDDDGSGAEVRAVLRGMSDQQRMQSLEPAIRGEDFTILRAIWNKPFITHGVPDETVQAIREQYLKVLFPAEVARGIAYRKANANLQRLDQQMPKFLASLTHDLAPVGGLIANAIETNNRWVAG